jgi:hypothetical protein
MNETDAQLIEFHQKLKAKAASMKEVFANEIKPYDDGMETIETELMRRLIERGAKNTKTEHGTAYMVDLLNIKVVDRDAFLRFCTQYWDTIGAEMLNVSALKDPVKNFMNGSKEPPPGLELSTFTRLNVRRT